MRVIPLNRFAPLGNKGGCWLLMIVIRAEAADSPVAKLTPNDIAHAVRVVEEALLKHLLVEASAVKAGIQ